MASENRHRTRLVMLTVKAILLLVASAHASFLVRSSFGDAFCFSPSNRKHSRITSSGRKLQRRIRIPEQNSFSKDDAGRSPTSSTTATFVFSRLDQTPTRTTTTRKTAANSKRSSAALATRGYCPKCQRPNVVCICHALPPEPIDCGTRILILQHPREAKKRKRTSTVPLIGLSLKQVEICVGTTFGEGSHPLLDEALAMSQSNKNNGHALLLYPSERAVPLQTYLEQIRNANHKDGQNVEDCESPSNNSNILVVVDGTWAQTQTMVQNSAGTLQRLPSVMFDEKTDSLFDFLRQEPAEHCTSTLEAVAKAIRLMGTIGSSNTATTTERAADALEQSLRAMVDGQLRFANDENKAKPRYYRKNESDVVLSKRQQGRTRKLVSKKLQAGLSLPRAKTKEELELERIRFVYIAHMG